MNFILEFDDGIEVKNIGEFKTDKEARAAMVQDLSSKGIKPYYYRSWQRDDATECIDYGSHYSFYYIKEED